MKNYDWIGYFYGGFARVRLNGKWGFINEKYEEVIKCKYDDCEAFDNGFALVSLKEKYNYINNQGQTNLNWVDNWQDSMLLLEKYKFNQNRILKLKTIV
jgi:hypothetical protein